METERNAFVTSLVKFTLLSNTGEMKFKNIQSIRTVIRIADSDGNYLQGSWAQILSCISQLERIHLIGTGSPDGSLVPSFKEGEPSTAKASFENVNASTIADEIDAVMIERIFTNTKHLQSDAIVHFVRGLCEISLSEIRSPRPRIFSLQKLVEISYYNMDRIRLVWSRIWAILSSHFKTVGCDENLNIAMYAVDSLRQLATKFLEKSELTNYNFQKDFIQPFEDIISNNPKVQIRELVIHCLSQMITARAEKLKSGWKSVLAVFTTAASDREASIVALAFQTLEGKIMTSFHLIASTFFSECVACLVNYGLNPYFCEYAIRAAKSLGFCASQLAGGNVIAGLIDFTNSQQHKSYWLPLLGGLSRMIAHPHVDVRTAALEQLFLNLKAYAQQFDKALWRDIFSSVLWPIFDNVRNVQEDNEWILTTSLNALTHLVELFGMFYDHLSDLSPEFLAVVASCCVLENESVARIGVTCFLQIVVQNSCKWSERLWVVIALMFAFLLKFNSLKQFLALEDSSAASSDQISVDHITGEESEDTKINLLWTLLEPSNPLRAYDSKALQHGNAKQAASAARRRCSIQLLVVQSINDVAMNCYTNLQTVHLLMLAASLKSTVQFACSARQSSVARKVKELGLQQQIIRAECNSLICYLRILFQLNADGIERRQAVEERLLKQCLRLLRNFASTNDDTVSKQQLPIVVFVLDGLLSLPKEQFLQHLAATYPAVVELCLVQYPDVRSRVRQFLLRVPICNALTSPQ